VANGCFNHPLVTIELILDHGKTKSTEIEYKKLELPLPIKIHKQDFHIDRKIKKEIGKSC